MSRRLIATTISFKYAGTQKGFSPVTANVLNKNGAYDESETIACRNIVGSAASV